MAESEAAKTPPPVGFALAGVMTAGTGMPTSRDRYALNDPAMPENSVLVVDIKGAIFKEGFCGSAGSLDYARIINDAYANDKIIGIVCLIDSPGGQLSGTPTLYDAIRNPQKPTVSVVNEGVMASAAYWLACGSDYIMATQKTDMIGSIGVMVRMRDSTEADAKEGYKTITVYSTRSPQKNKPYRDALAGDTAALEAELDQAADLFREAVETGRGDKLKPAKKGETDVFEGGMLYAGKAIERGLIDGYGDLNAAVAKVVELHEDRQNNPPPSPNQAAFEQPTITDISSPTVATTVAPEAGDLKPADAPAAEGATDTTSPSQTPENPMSIFGYSRLVALTAIAGIAAEAVTDEQVAAINTELQANGFNVAAISQADFVEATSLKATLSTTQTALTTANAEVTRLKAEVDRLGKQPGTTPTTSAKNEETISTETVTFISETDAELARLKAQK